MDAQDPPAGERLRLLLPAMARALDGTAAFILYEATRAFALESPAEAALFPDVTATPGRLYEWFSEHLGEARCTNGDTFMANVDRALAGGAQVARLYRFDTYSLLADLMVRGAWPEHPRQIRAQATRQSVTQYLPRMHAAQLLNVRGGRNLFVPNYHSLSQFRQFLVGRPLWPTDIQDVVVEEESVGVLVEPDGGRRRVRGGLASAELQYDIWRKVDAVIASADLRAVQRLSNVAPRIMQAFLGKECRRLVVAMQQRGASAPGNTISVANRVRYALSCSLYHRWAAPSMYPGFVTREILLDASRFARRQCLAVREFVLCWPDDVDEPPCRHWETLFTHEPPARILQRRRQRHVRTAHDVARLREYASAFQGVPSDCAQCPDGLRG